MHGDEQVEDQLSLLFALMLQAATAVPPDKIDLTVRRPCDAEGSGNDEIIVCGNRDGSSPYRVTQLPPPVSGIPTAEVQIADGVKIAGETENVDVGGFPSERFMLRLKIKF